MGLDPSSPEMTFVLVMLHTGTMFAVIVYFWNAWREHYFSSASAFRSVAINVVIATFVTGVIGLALQLLIEKVFLKGSAKAEVEVLFSQLPLIGGALNLQPIRTQWTELLRLATSIKQGTVTASGDAMAFQCSVIADQIRFAGAKTTIDARNCSYATVQRQTPAVLLNTFGKGMAAYSAFDWQGAMGQYEATPGVLTTLFGKIAGAIAPTQNPLRAGTIVPLTTTVQSLNDPFQGTLKLAANDDAVFNPLGTTWPVDFTKQNPVVVNNTIRLGSSSSTLITATVSATRVGSRRAASPIQKTPFGKAGTSSAADSIASRVFPEPPGPDSVTRRASSCSSPMTSDTSRSRPTNDDAGRGKFVFEIVFSGGNRSSPSWKIHTGSAKSFSRCSPRSVSSPSTSARVAADSTTWPPWPEAAMRAARCSSRPA